MRGLQIAPAVARPVVAARGRRRGKFFDEEQYALNFLNGRLYCNRLSYFRGLEEQNLPERADQHEGLVAWGQPGIFRIEINGHDISNDLAAPASLSSNRLGDFNVLCMHAGYVNETDVRFLDDSSKLRELLLIPDECMKFGQIAVVIKNGPEFLKRVSDTARALSYREAHSLVRYYDPNTFSGFFPEISGAFMKQTRFQQEREYRIAFETGNSGADAVELDIGDIRDIAIRSTINEINKNLKIESNRPSRTERC